MKKLISLIILITLFTACKNEIKPEVNLEENRSKSYDQNDGLVTMRGDFIYYDVNKDEPAAAVLQTQNEIYGVVIDDKMHELNNEVKPFKTEDTDMVPVTVRVLKFEKPEGEEGWPYRVEIKDILKVEAPNKDKKDVIKLAN